VWGVNTPICHERGNWGYTGCEGILCGSLKKVSDDFKGDAWVFFWLKFQKTAIIRAGVIRGSARDEDQQCESNRDRVGLHKGEGIFGTQLWLKAISWQWRGAHWGAGGGGGGGFIFKVKKI
jgi:hypothetical protein